jgi:dTMP kinase
VPDHPVRGRFISLEGVDGAGKSTHAGWLADALGLRGHRVVRTREPGGTALGEALLMFAARREHVVQVIEPALARGDWVLCDRFTDATYAYQGGGHFVAIEFLRDLERRVHPDCNPDLTLLFDVPPEVSRQRLAQSAHKGRELDKFERESTAFFERVRAAYFDRAKADPARFRIIDATKPIAEVRGDLARIVAEL